MENLIEVKRSEIVAAVKRLRRQLESGDDSDLLVWVIPKALAIAQRPLRHHPRYGGSGLPIPAEAKPLILDWIEGIRLEGIASIISFMHDRDLRCYHDINLGGRDFVAFLQHEGFRVCPLPWEDPAHSKTDPSVKKAKLEHIRKVGRTRMHFGVFTTLQNRTWPDLQELWRHIEATGWDIACVPDHLAPVGSSREGSNLEALSTLSALAALVPRIRLGTIVLSNTFRHPAVLAKAAAQIDIISGGRLVLGLGSGWHPGEHEAYGIPFPSMRERMERLDEACQVIRSLWTERRSTFDGRHYQLSDAPLDPKPVQTPHPPLMIGGGGERVTLRLVAAHADACNFFGGPKVFARKLAILDQHCAAIGRDPKTIRHTASMFLLFTTDQREIDRLAAAAAAFPGDQVSDGHDACLAGTPDQIRERLHLARAAGVDTVFIPTVLRPLPEIRRDLDRFITEIAPEFR